MSMMQGCEESCDENERVSPGNDIFIDYTVPPSLQSIALVSIAIRLWEDTSIREGLELIMGLGSDVKTQEQEDTYHEIEERVHKKLEKLFLPKSLKIKVSNIITPIGLQLLRPVYYLNKTFGEFYVSKMGGSLYWTMEGTIDKVKSLKELINSASQEKNFDYLYEVACKYCLEENVSYLWKNICLEKKKTFHNDSCNRYEHHIVDYWTAFLENELPNLFSKIKFCDYSDIYDSNHSIYRNMTSMSVFVGNIFALKYFWRKLTEQEKIENIKIWLDQTLLKCFRLSKSKFQIYQRCHADTDILFFLLSQLKDRNEQNRIFQNHSWVILKASFAHWPWQRFFLPTINQMFDYLPENVYIKIMIEVTEEIREGKTTEKLFREVWHRSPLKLKKSFIPFVEGTIWNLLEVEDVKTVYMILDIISVEEKKELAYKLVEYYRFTDIVYSRKWTIFETMMPKLLASDNEIKSFKSRVIQKHAHIFPLLIVNGDIQKADTLLNWGFQFEDEIQNFKKTKINPMRTYNSLLRLGNYENIKQFMMWYFVTEEDISSFKKAFVKKSNFSRCFNILMEMSGAETGWNHFGLFINYSLTSPEEVSQFKKLYMKIASTSVKRGNLEFATKFLNWCFDSSDEINRFKNKLLLSKKGIGMLLYRLNHKCLRWEKLKYQLKWFFPLTSKTIDKLKSLLQNDKFPAIRDWYPSENKKQAFFYLVEYFFSKYSTPDWENNYPDDIVIKNILKGKDIYIGSDSSNSYYSDYS